MKTILKPYIKRTSLYFGFFAIIILSACDTNEDADRISVTPQERPTIISVEPTSGRFGDEITITGTNFDPQIVDNSVILNGIEATIVSATPTSLVATVPNGASTGSIEVSVINFDVSGPTFTVLAPLPILSDITPLTGGISAEVTIAGENFGANISDNTVSFNGTTAVITASSTTSITTSVPTGATAGPVSVTAPGGTVTSSTDFKVLSITTLSIPLTSNDDDAEEVAEVDPTIDPGDPIPTVGDMNLSSSDLEFGEISSNEGLQNIGLRFNNVTIPKGASITNAKIQFKCDDDGSDPVEVTIYGEAVDNSISFTLDNGNISARPLTTANAIWNIDPWLAAGDRLPAQQTVDLSNIIQEIIDRPGWASGNSISIIFKHTGVSVGATSSSTGREAENYSSSTPDDGAELTITFQS